MSFRFAAPFAAFQAPLWLWASALIPRLALWLCAWSDPELAVARDSHGYLARAANLLQRGRFATGDALHVETFRTPGYPLFLAAFMALFGDPVLPAAFAQCLLGAWAAATAWVWLERAFGRRSAWPAAVLALDPVTVFHTPLLLTETLFVFLLVAALASYWEVLEHPTARGAMRSGLWSDLASLVRPISLYLPLLLAWPFWNRRRLLAAFLAAAWLLPAAWTARNRAAVGYWMYSSIAGVANLRYPAAGIEAWRTGRPRAEVERELRERVDSRHPEGYASDAQKSREYGAEALVIMQAHPVVLTEYCLWRAVRLLGGTGLEMLVRWRGVGWASADDPSLKPGVGTLALLTRHPWLIPMQVLYTIALAALYAAAAVGLLLLARDGRRREVLLLAGGVLYFLLLSAPQGYYRYRIPLLPFLAAAAAPAVASWQSRRRGRGPSATPGDA